MGFFDFFKSKRGEEIRLVASRNHYVYETKDENGILRWLLDFQLFKLGGVKKITHVLSKPERDGEMLQYLFDYQYTVNTGKTSVTHRQTVFFVYSKELGLPPFYLKPENLFHTIGSWLGFHDIDFPDYPEFSDKYYLKGEETDIIRQVFNREIIDFFLTHPGLSMEGLNYFFILYKHGHLINPLDIPAFFEESIQLYSLLQNRGYQV